MWLLVHLSISRDLSYSTVGPQAFTSTYLLCLYSRIAEHLNNVIACLNKKQFTAKFIEIK